MISINWNCDFQLSFNNLKLFKHVYFHSTNANVIIIYKNNRLKINFKK